MSDIENVLTLGPWRQKQARILLKYLSLRFLREGLVEADALVAMSDRHLGEATLQGRDKYIANERWGVRDTSANWASNAYPALLEMREAIVQRIARRSLEIYTEPGLGYFAGMFREQSMFWATPEQEKKFRSGFASLYDRFSKISSSAGTAGDWTDFHLSYYWRVCPEEFSDNYKFRIRKDIEGVSGFAPPRTGIYVPQDDSCGILQFAWTGKQSQTLNGKTMQVSNGALRDCRTLNSIGREALEYIGREGLWFDDDSSKAFVRDSIQQELIKNNPNYEEYAEEGYFNEFVKYGGITTRPCKWYYVEVTDRDPDEVEPAPAPLDRLRGEPDEIVPRSGWWKTTAIDGEGGYRFFNAGDRFPETRYTAWGAVIWGFSADPPPLKWSEAHRDPAEFAMPPPAEIDGKPLKSYDERWAAERAADEEAESKTTVIDQPPAIKPVAEAGDAIVIAAPDRLPLGTLASAGRTCPQTGWWECDVFTRLKGERRRHFKAGEPMPTVQIKLDATLWQRLTDSGPLYTSQAVWRLVAYDI